MEPAFKVTGDARKGSVKATYASDRPCLRESAGGRKGGRKGIADREWTDGGKEYPKRQITKDFRKKAEHFQTNKRGYENVRF